MYRIVPSCLLVCACAEWQRPPTTAPYQPGQPVLQEQALAGLAENGSVAALQLVQAEGMPPRLELLALDGGGGPTRRLLAAPDPAARAAAARLLADGRRAVPLLGAIAAQEWPEGLRAAAEHGYRPRAPLAPEPGRKRWPVAGAPGAGSLPLQLRTAFVEADPPAFALLLGERPGGETGGDEVELARQPLAGAPVEGDLWVQGRTVWFLSGAVGKGEPMYRTVGLRRGSLARGEAQLHNGHGLADYAAGDLDAARREFDRAIAADPRFVDSLYNAAAAAALSDRIDDAVALLRRAAEADPRRVQVLGRDDDDLKVLRKRADVRALLGMKRPAPADTEEK